jgi:hypothetical protein
VAADVPDAGEQLVALLVGERLVRRVREMGKLLSERSGEGRPPERGRP